MDASKLNDLKTQQKKLKKQIEDKIKEKENSHGGENKEIIKNSSILEEKDIALLKEWSGL